MSTTTQRYLDLVRSRLEIQSDYKLAQVLGISRGLVSLQRQGKSGMGDATALRVAELLELDPLVVIGEMHAERAQDERAKAYWRELAEKARGAAAAVILSALAGLGLAADPARASVGYDATGADRAGEPVIHYAHLLRRLLAWLLGALERSAEAGA